MDRNRAAGLFARAYRTTTHIVLALVATTALLATEARSQETACPEAGACAKAEGWVEGPSGLVWTEYEIVDGVAVIEGDIAVRVADPLAPRSATRPGWTWPGGVIPYTIAPGADAFLVQDAIAHWHANTDVRLVPRSGESSYVEFFSGDGCWSYVGRQGGRQQISLAPGCGFGAAVHEIGHATGLWHEQSRRDRDQWVVIHWANIQPGQEHNFDFYPDGHDEGPYDYASIMHYSPYSFSRNGLPTIEPVQPGATIGQRNGLSTGDRSGIAALYGFGPPPPPTGSVALSNGVTVPGISVTVGDFRRFHLEVPAGTQRLAFELSGDLGDGDLYVSYASEPTFESFDCRPYSGSSNESCTFDAPAAGTYHVMVHAYSSVSDLQLVGHYDGDVNNLFASGDEKIKFKGLGSRRSAIALEIGLLGGQFTATDGDRTFQGEIRSGAKPRTYELELDANSVSSLLSRIADEASGFTGAPMGLQLTAPPHIVLREKADGSVKLKIKVKAVTLSDQGSHKVRYKAKLAGR